MSTTTLSEAQRIVRLERWMLGGADENGKLILGVLQRLVILEKIGYTGVVIGFFIMVHLWTGWDIETIKNLWSAGAATLHS